MEVRDYARFTRLHLFTCENSIIEAANVIAVDSVCGIIVVGESGMVGTLGAADIVAAVAGGVSVADKIGTLHLTPPLVVSPKDQIALALSAMLEACQERAVVVNNGRPVGIISLHELAHAANDRRLRRQPWA